MKVTILALSLCLISCATRSTSEAKGPVGSSATQAATQQAADEISSPAMPATQQPAPGTVILAPVVSP